MKNLFCIIFLMLTAFSLTAQEGLGYTISVYTGVLPPEILDGTITTSDVDGGGREVPDRLTLNDRYKALILETADLDPADLTNLGPVTADYVNDTIFGIKDDDKSKKIETMERMMLTNGQFRNSDGSDFEIHAGRNIVAVQTVRINEASVFSSDQFYIVVVEGTAQTDNRREPPLHWIRVMSVPR